MDSIESSKREFRKLHSLAIDLSIDVPNQEALLQYVFPDVELGSQQAVKFALLEHINGPPDYKCLGRLIDKINDPSLTNKFEEWKCMYLNNHTQMVGEDTAVPVSSSHQVLTSLNPHLQSSLMTRGSSSSPTMSHKSSSSSSNGSLNSIDFPRSVSEASIYDGSSSLFEPGCLPFLHQGEGKVSVTRLNN